VSGIINFSDLVSNHLEDVGGTARINDNDGMRILLTVWTVSNVATNGMISADDFIF